MVVVCVVSKPCHGGMEAYAWKSRFRESQLSLNLCMEIHWAVKALK